MIGTILNVLGILLGGSVGKVKPKALSPANESFFKVTLGAFTVFYGLRLTWISLHGSVWQVMKQVVIVVLALMLGKITGRLLHLQHLSNRLGQSARKMIGEAQAGSPERGSLGFRACALLYCAAPLGILGAVQDGLADYFYPLAIKGVVDGLATMGFVPLLGGRVMLAALPVLALQGTISLVCLHWLKPFLDVHGLIDPINATGGLLVFSVALVILGLKKIELTDYLPSLLFAPLLTWIVR